MFRFETIGYVFTQYFLRGSDNDNSKIFLRTYGIFLQRKSGKVIVIDSSGAERTMLAEVVRSLGFGDVNGVSGIKEAVEMIEVESVDWVISPLQTDNTDNIFQVIDLIYSDPILRHIRV